jgi:hypothetical protein
MVWGACLVGLIPVKNCVNPALISKGRIALAFGQRQNAFENKRSK